MLKSLKTLETGNHTPYRIPKTVHDLIPISQVWEDGIFRSDKLFSRSYAFSDINYLSAGLDRQEQILRSYADLLNSLDSSASAKITIFNRRTDITEYEKNLFMPMQNNDRDIYRREHNGILADSFADAQGFRQERYVTISKEARNYEEAAAFFRQSDSGLQSRFAELDVSHKPLRCSERLRILHDFYRPQDIGRYAFNLLQTAKLGHHFKDGISPDGMESRRDYLMLGDRYCRVLYLKNYASFLRDVLVSALTANWPDTILSVDLLPIPTEEAVNDTERRLLGAERNIADWQQRQNKNNNFSATVPFELEQQRDAIKDFMDGLVRCDQRMFQVTLTIAVCADSLEELEGRTKQLQSIGQNHRCQLSVLYYRQIDGLNTVLPIGLWRIHAYRTLTSDSLSLLEPFRTLEIQDAGGVFLGQNTISHQPILCDRSKLMNQASIITGVPGSGKSMLAKWMIAATILNSKDDILIADPESEYVSLVEALAGEEGAVVHIAADGKNRLNAMQLSNGYGDADSLADKSQFILSLVEQISDQGIGPTHRSVLDRCTSIVFAETKASGRTPTLSLLREALLHQPEPEAKQLALTLELFTKGTLNIFGHESNVRLDKRVTVFDIHGLGSQLKGAGLLVITDTMLNRVNINARQGKRTHVFIDEFHTVFGNQSSAEFFDSAWRQFRKRNAWPTAISQNMDVLLASPQARSMVSNSELLIMLNQAPSDRERLQSILNLSADEMQKITNVEPGSGLIRYGGALIPFTNRFPTNTKLYALMNTKPDDKNTGGDIDA